MSLMWFFDDIPEEYRVFREEAHRLESEHLQIRKALQEAEAALRADPSQEHLRSRVDGLKNRLAELDRQAPWLTADVLKEYDLWGVPH